MSGPVLIDARAAARPELGGVERWARELSARLPAAHPGRYEVARPPQALSHRAGHAWEQVVLPARAARRSAPLIVCPANLAPVVSRRTLVVIHDAAALREPAWYSRAYVAWQRAILPLVARRAKHIVTVSEYSAAELVELLGVPRGRITVIPGGVDDRFRPDADADGARRALGLGGPYVLTVASRTARKNLAVLDAAARVLGERGIELVAAGGDRPQFSGDGPGGVVRALGHVPDDLLPGLYAGAEAFVLPSLHEGFGLTCVEAMAAGTPVVASDRAALVATVGDAGILVDPEDADAVAHGVLRALGDDALRAAGPRRAAHFTWERTVAELDALVTRLLGQRP